MVSCRNSTTVTRRWAGVADPVGIKPAKLKVDGVVEPTKLVLIPFLLRAKTRRWFSVRGLSSPVNLKRLIGIGFVNQPYKLARHV